MYAAAALAALFSVAAIAESANLRSLQSADVWGHLRIGMWILEHGSVPRTGVYSQAANVGWRDLTWGYDVVSAALYKIAGPGVVPAMAMASRIGLAVVTFVLAGGRRHLWRAVVLSAGAQYVLGGFWAEASVCSMLLFGIELAVLRESWRVRNVRYLYVLPALFVVWANVDGGFVYGIGAYALVALSQLVESTYRKAANEIPTARTATIGLMCLAATLLNPYGYQAWGAAFGEQIEGLNVAAPGYTAMSFRQPQDYALLLLAMAAFVCLGMRRVRRVFPLWLLILSMIVAAGFERMAWLAVMASLAVIGDEAWGEGVEVREPPQIEWKLAGVAVAMAVAVGAAAFVVKVAHKPDQLLARAAQSLPVAASDYIRQHELPKPLFNMREWGGWVIWYLPEYPVAMDNRLGLYGRETEECYEKAMKAEIAYQSCGFIRQARTLLMKKGSVLGEAFRGLPGFRVEYEDNVAIVLRQESREVQGETEHR